MPPLAPFRECPSISCEGIQMYQLHGYEWLFRASFPLEVVPLRHSQIPGAWTESIDGTRLFAEWGIISLLFVFQRKG
jgi:hypothetical protein